MQEITDFLSNHKATLSVVAVWAMREAHVCWPVLLRIWPGIVANGGLKGILTKLLTGESKPQTQKNV